MSLRPTPDPELVPLVRAIKARIEGLGPTTCTSKDGVDAYHRDKTAFLHLELRRDYMTLDLWLSDEQLEEARASGIARAHPFLGDDAVKVRFERAEDLSRVARWIEASYAYAVERAKGPPVRVVQRDTQLISMPPPSPRGGESGRAAPAAGPTKAPGGEAASGKPSPSGPPAPAVASKAKPAGRAKRATAPAERGKGTGRARASAAPKTGGGTASKAKAGSAAAAPRAKAAGAKKALPSKRATGRGTKAKSGAGRSRSAAKRR